MCNLGEVWRPLVPEDVAASGRMIGFVSPEAPGVAVTNVA